MAAAQASPAQIPLGAYIFRRLRSIGVHHIFGCPGDFNLNLLDHLYTVEDINWIGTCNELNGAYAADGYARVRGIPGVLVTTYGVGELSAINGISGAYSEHVPIIHIVGTTSRLAQKDHTMIHHTLGEQWDHDTFQQMSKPVRSAAANLVNDASFAEDVDKVIEVCVKTRKPVYIFVPMDTPDILISSERLDTPLDLEITNPGKEDIEAEIVELILNRMQTAEKPSVLVDVFAHRYGLAKVITELLDFTAFPGFVTPLSKSILDETGPHYNGLYNGKLTPSKQVKDRVENADFLLHIGPLPSDSNTGGWSQNFNEKGRIILHPDYISIWGRRWDGVNFVPIVKKLLAAARARKTEFTKSGSQFLLNNIPSSIQKNGIVNGNSKLALRGPLEQHHVWKQFSPFLRKGDCVIAEVGSAQYGTLDLELPTEAVFFTQLYYSCIGFTVGALLGALVARREQGNNGRVILFVGDGSLHMTVQEISTIIRNGFKPTIVLINNQGYTIERVIHGPAQQYNDISESWDYQQMLHFFGAPKASKSYRAGTYEELESVLRDPEFNSNQHIQLLEIFMDKFDSPWMLTEQVNIMQEKSSLALRKWDEECGRKRLVLDSNLFRSQYVLSQSASQQAAAKSAELRQLENGLE